MAGNIRVGVCGAAGRMGRAIIAILEETDGAELSAAVEYSTHPAVGKDAGEVAGLRRLGVAITNHVGEAAKASDVIIDFSHADVTLEVAKEVAAAGSALVIGTTGHDETEREAIREAVSEIACVWAPNMSVGVTVMLRLVADAARALGEDFDIEVVEMHHRHKKDAPSGTAMRLGEVLAESIGSEFAKTAVYARQGMTGARRRGSIGMQTLRGGDVVGEHTVYFAGVGERIEIVHRATDRAIFARGAVRAARWVVGKSAGLYGMDDVLGL